MSFLKPFLTVIFLISAAVATCAQQQIEPASEQEIVRLVNAERTKAGLDPLTVDSRLTDIARQHSQLMLSRKTLSHQLSGEGDVRQRVISSGVRFDMSGENVAYDRDAASAHRSLMNSPPHRANILRPEFTTIGVGVVRIGDSIYVTQDFARRLQEMSPTQAETAVSRSFDALRRNSGVPPLKLVPQPSLRDLACNMASQDRLETDLARDIANVRSVLVWTATEPQKLPSDMQKLRTTSASRWSVGACFASSRRYQNPVWWMIAVTYF
jgi:hypothetical protein